MSEAVVCTDTHLERQVVIKSLKPGADSKRILDELAALQSIRSKHVVQIYDVIRDSSGNVVGIVEEYLPGDDLTSVSSPKNADEFLRLAYPIAEGIADIHTHNRVHRDIKRQNMKFDAEDCLKIFDFGLARDAAVEASTMGEIGTPGYMAPELFSATKGTKVVFDKEVDVFAFGATLLAITLGTLPKDLKEVPPKLPCAEADFAKLGIGIPAPLVSLLNKCFAIKASDRPTMPSIASSIGQFLLQNKHRALIASNSRTDVLDSTNAVVQLSVQGQGSLNISYTGFEFVVWNVTGHVSINNIPTSNGYVLPGSCVIVLGPASSFRTFVTVDVSHPEVSL
ncbi:MAG: serine/threonine protein kinase [Bradyrhizobium sp.]|uniref:serine/threonine-protein kinase n=1 Tax=Bradyrhizobium sp. TaxID=376 RepID=UPI001C28E288|nr:serine/threonine-protein kinase [Bradyrhizobium sp.]MBU6464331.1 serine/threonine protein kinase [Pseudomonadota bacterium]MDE2068217.1 serine/threonine protein kinase [Bradyrhizobium sp.]MDE2471722.1 serine/threonine protein kinase [Bradyrhizobium sp.]